VGTRGAVPSERLPAAGRRAVILSAANQVFAELGYTAAYSAKIAQFAGTSDALTFQHFPTKADLYEAVIDRAAGALADRVRRSVSPGAAPAQQLAQGISAVIEFARQEPDAWRNLIDTGGAPQRVIEKRRALHGQATRVITRLLAQEAKRRRRRIPPRLLEAHGAMTIGAIIALAKMRKPDPRLVAGISALRM
jgi:AcrR family transcriptional regulator